MLISIVGHSVAYFDTQSAFNRRRTTTFKASWIQSTSYDYRLDGPAIREPNLSRDGLYYVIGYGGQASTQVSAQ
jgi:hypothetical protein